MKNNKHNQKHLSLSDRIFIEQELVQGNSFSSISKSLGKDPTTISKEVKKHRIISSEDWKVNTCRGCINYNQCSEHHVCGSEDCKRICIHCRKFRVHELCDKYHPHICNQPFKPPYVCNSCTRYRSCLLEKAKYIAYKAQKNYETLLSSSRKGINMTPDELDALNELISPLVLKGQPLSHIFAVHSDEIPVCRRTLYNYFDQRVFTARNIDLPRRVRYKRRKNRSAPRKTIITPTYRNKRTFIDFEKYTTAFPDLDVVEMDTVKGNRSTGKCLLTLLFRSCSFMIIILLPSCTQKSVIDAINNLCDTIGIRAFKKYFPIILTDNGPEFKNPWEIEKNESGTPRTKVFYCDPYVSNQKAKLEKNHEYIRYVIPKGRSMYKYTQEDINLMASHINSTARDSLNGATPFDLASLLIDKKIPELMGQAKIPADSVYLKPSLVNENVAKRKQPSEKGGAINE